MRDPYESKPVEDLCETCVGEGRITTVANKSLPCPTCLRRSSDTFITTLTEQRDQWSRKAVDAVALAADAAAVVAEVRAERDAYKRKYDTMVISSGSTCYVCDACGHTRNGKRCMTCEVREWKQAAIDANARFKHAEEEMVAWRTKALDVCAHPAVVALMRERDEARTHTRLIDDAGSNTSQHAPSIESINIVARPPSNPL